MLFLSVKLNKMRGNNHKDHISFFAETNFRNLKRKFGIKLADRRRHIYIIGKTGVGKSTLLLNMIVSDIRAGLGLCLIDPHGDLVDEILEYIPSSRIKDVIFFNPTDVEYPIAFNLFENVSPVQRPLVASGIISVFKKIWSEFWGPRLEYVLRSAILALLEREGSTLLDLPRLLTDENFRQDVITSITDPVVKSFWESEYEKYPKVFRTETISPIQNKVGQYLSSFLIRNIVGHKENKFNLREVIDTGKILLVNLSKGAIGEDYSKLLGSMLVTKLYLAGLGRANIPEQSRNFFAVYVDEFQEFAHENFFDILSESRKYNLGLTITNQHLSQLEEKVKSSVIGNVGTLIAFRTGSEDSEILAKEFHPTFNEDDLISLPKYQIYLKLLINGTASEAFSATTLPQPNRKSYHKQDVIRFSRERYCTPRKVVEGQIRKSYQTYYPQQKLFNPIRESKNKKLL